MFLPIALFLVFALLCAVGAYLILAHHRSRAAGVWAALGTTLFFGLLFFGLLALLRSAGL
ncbi:MAG TPA: hypothetical protein VF414_15890 [Thermoanaerobaculia bacterium]